MPGAARPEGIERKTMESSRYCLAALLITLSGCGGGPSPDGKQSYRGEVTWNGDPLPDGTITFFSDKGKADAAPITNGRFTVRATPGEKGISVVAEKEIGTPPPSARMPNPTPVRFQYLPKDANTNSTLKQTFPDDPGAPIEIALTGKALEPPRDALQPQD